MSLYKTVLSLALITAFLSSCSSTDEKQDELLQNELNQNQSENASTSPFNQNNSLAGESFQTQALSGEDLTPQQLGPEFSDPNNPLSKSTIYFSYDSSNIRQDFLPVIAAHAQYLNYHPAQKIILGGHADERGSREYNIALGEQRAKAVYRMMKAQGVTADQIEIVSYGEEKPAAPGLDDASFQLNRRVEIAYQGG